jgi:hypothetical protein
VVHSVTGDASAHLFKYYVAMIMYLAPYLLVDGLIGPTKSISHLSNTCNITRGCRGISSLTDGFPTRLKNILCLIVFFSVFMKCGKHNHLLARGCKNLF